VTKGELLVALIPVAVIWSVIAYWGVGMTFAFGGQDMDFWYWCKWVVAPGLFDLGIIIASIRAVWRWRSAKLSSPKTGSGSGKSKPQHLTRCATPWLQTEGRKTRVGETSVQRHEDR
jgi:hypothetical protein